MRFGGRFSTSFQLGVTGCAPAGDCELLNFRNTNVVALTVDATPSRSVELRGDLAVRNINFTRIASLDDLGDVSKVQPVDLRINEARLDLFDLFGVKGLDLSAGAMRVAWGTADGVNPVDHVNALDLEDGTGFDRRLPSPAILVAYTIGPVRLEVVAVPLFTPALLPIEQIDVTTLGDPSAVFAQLDAGDVTPPEVKRVETPAEAPDPSLDEVQAGARVVWHAPAGDFAVMAWRGRDSLPQAAGEARLTGFQTTSRVDLGVPLVFPRLALLGADWRGPIAGDLSGWAEVAVLFPERTAVTFSRAQLEALVKLGHLEQVPDPVPERESQSDTPFVQAVAGLEYLLFDLLYVNLQYARGMPTERQAGDVHDYALLALRMALLGGQLLLEARAGLEVGGPDALGYTAGGAVSWLHGDAARLTLSTTFLGGDPGTTFRQFERFSQVRLAFGTAF